MVNLGVTVEKLPTPWIGKPSTRRLSECPSCGSGIVRKIPRSRIFCAYLTVLNYRSKVFTEFVELLARESSRPAEGGLFFPKKRTFSHRGLQIIRTGVILYSDPVSRLASYHLSEEGTQDTGFKEVYVNIKENDRFFVLCIFLIFIL